VDSSSRLKTSIPLSSRDAPLWVRFSGPAQLAGFSRILIALGVVGTKPARSEVWIYDTWQLDIEGADSIPLSQ
jgi:hypothetical protein